jgi:hypothetical protein
VDSTEVAHRGRAVLAQRTGFPSEKHSSNRMQVQKDSVRFKKVRTGSTYVQVRAEPMDHPEHAEKVRLPETVRFRFRFFGSANPLCYLHIPGFIICKSLSFSSCFLRPLRPTHEHHKRISNGRSHRQVPIVKSPSPNVEKWTF